MGRIEMSWQEFGLERDLEILPCSGPGEVELIPHTGTNVGGGSLQRATWG